MPNVIADNQVLIGNDIYTIVEPDNPAGFLKVFIQRAGSTEPSLCSSKGGFPAKVLDKLLEMRHKQDKRRRAILDLSYLCNYLNQNYL